MKCNSLNRVFNPTRLAKAKSFQKSSHVEIVDVSSMVDVVLHEKAFGKSKIHATIIEKVRLKMVEDPSPTRPPPGGKKWEEIVGLNGARYAVACRWEGDKVMITRVRRSPTRKVRIRKRKK